ncbi:MAG TPA: hypothetical protein QGG70_04115 [Candidatus Pacearchaeota archaeon]|jgi:hypothetical protein|nr:hypothetical protein [Candidatus Pacearchaeota archaeon]
MEDYGQLLSVLEQSRTGWIAEAVEHAGTQRNSLLSIKPCIHKAPSQSLYLGPGSRGDLFVASGMAERGLEFMGHMQFGDAIEKFTYKILLPEDFGKGMDLSQLDEILGNMGNGFPIENYVQNKFGNSKFGKNKGLYSGKNPDFPYFSQN